MASPVALHLSDRFHQYGAAFWWRSAPTGVEPQGTLPTTSGELSDWALVQTGLFAAVIETPMHTSLITDFARSIPLFYTLVDNTWHVSDDVNRLIELLPSPTLDSEAAEVFRHCGVVLGQRTLVEGIYQVPAASIVTLPHDSTQASSSVYRLFAYTHDYEGRDDEFETRVLDVLREQFRSVVQAANGRLLAIPLSGGIDSRLLAVLLKEIPEANLLAFTYGQKDSNEAHVSERVAREVGIPWVFVESDPQVVRKVWAEHGHAFLRDAWAGASLPHYQDWYALHVLTQDGTLPPDTILLPGHTIVGNMHNDEVLNDPTPMSPAEMARVLMGHHGKAQGDVETLAKQPYLHQVMREFFEEVHYDGSLEKRQDVIEWFNIRERQAKYINNSMRAYEHFGLDWAMPMLHAPFVELWQQGSHRATDEARSWYKEITNRLYESATGETIGYFTTTVNQLPPVWKQIGVNVAEKTGIATLLRRSLSAKTQINHPMAFHALLNDDNSSRIIAQRTLRGSSLQGEFIDRFLANTWLPGPDIVPSKKD